MIVTDVYLEESTISLEGYLVNQLIVSSVLDQNFNLLNLSVYLSKIFLLSIQISEVLEQISLNIGLVM